MGDALAKQQKADLERHSSVLELMKAYIDALKLDPDNDAEPFKKMKRLFDLGNTPEVIEGHHSGRAAARSRQ